VFNEKPQHENSIRRWDRQLKETGSLLDKQHSGSPTISDDSVENIQNSFIRSPKKSVRKYGLMKAPTILLNISVIALKLMCGVLLPEIA
jgi:hypothetical protein